MSDSDMNGTDMNYQIDRLDEILQALRQRLRIAVVYSGDPRDPSAIIHRTHQARVWKSYEGVARDIAAALERLGFSKVFLLREGRDLGAHLQRAEVHLAWLNCGGIQGFDPLAQAPALLEGLGIPYVGHRPASATLLDNKYLCKRLLAGLGLPTAPFLLWHPRWASGLSEATLLETFGTEQGPWVVKPVNGRASRDVTYLEQAHELPALVAEIYGRTANAVLIESFLPGREVAVGAAAPLRRVDGRWTRTRGAWCFAFIERLLAPQEHIFESLDARPIDGSRARVLDRGQEGALIAKLQALGRVVADHLHLRSMFRMDLREDEHGELRILEINPKPDLKAPTSDGATSLLALGLADAGVSYDELVLFQLAAAIDDGLSGLQSSWGPIVEQLRLAGVPAGCPGSTVGKEVGAPKASG
ncbi:MAG: D-alanyl-alanine synthetase [Acidobacteriota bacterium]